MAAPVLLGETQDQEPVRLWILQPLTRQVARLMKPLRREFELFGALAVLVAALGATFVARSVLGPFTRFVGYMRSAAATEQRQGRFDAEDEAAEVRTLNDSFNQLMDSIVVKRRALEERFSPKRPSPIRLRARREPWVAAPATRDLPRRRSACLGG